LKKDKIAKRYKMNINILSAQLIYLIVIFSLAVSMFIILPSSIYFDIMVMLTTIILSYYVVSKELKNRKYRINELSQSVDIVLKDNLNKIDIPMVMIGGNSEIVWENELSKYIIPKEHINQVIYTFDKKKKQGESLKYTSDIGNGEIYCAIGNNITFSNFECTLITFISKTEESNLIKTLNDTRVAVGIVFIDNYEETMSGLDESDKSEITSKVDKAIRGWVIDNKGITAKLDKDKYAIFIEKQYVSKMEETKFNILEDIKNITNITKLPVTISIGMSINEIDLNDRYVSSSAALDIAMGRGGDQIVVKKDKKFDFYGGTSIGVEKTSRVRARTIATALSDIIDKCDKVYIVGHKTTDVDCVGAAVGMRKLAYTLGKEAYIIVDPKYNTSTKQMIDRVKTSKEYEDAFIGKEEFKKHNKENSLLIVVDTHKKTYLAVNDILNEFDKVVVIDHHRRGPEFIENAMLTYHEIYASSTCELVTELLMYLDNVKLSTVEAESLYAGILIDTKNFSFKTGVRTFEVAAYLKRVGMDISEVKQIFQNDFETYLAKVEIVKNAEIIDKQIAISVCYENYENMSTLVASAADELLSITGILASFVLCKIDNVVMISSRSMGDINVQSIMEKIGGGGHLTFAGAQIANISLEEAKSKLLNCIEEYFEK
jgi:cyclic-di-AMP phosphodiesterase